MKLNQRRHGALLAYVSIFINGAIALAFTPFMVCRLGQAGYGLFSIAGSFATYLAVLDIGLNDSIIRYLVGFQSRGEHDKYRHFQGVSLGLYLKIALLVTFFGGLLYAAVPGLFIDSLGSEQVHTLQKLTLIATVNIAFTIGLNPVTALITANERFVFLRLSEITAHLLTTLVAVALLLEGLGVVEVVAGMAITNLLFLFVKTLYAINRLDMQLRLYRAERDILKTMFGYSLPIIAVVIVEQIYWRLDNIILGAMIGAEVVAVYAIGLLFHKYFMRFGTAISRVMLPQVIREVERGADGQQITHLLVRVARLQAISLWLILSGLVLFGRQFIELWIGPDYRAAYWVMLCTLIPYSFELIGNLRNSVLQVQGLYWYRAIMVLAIALLNVILTIYLVRIFGLLGAAASTGIGVILGFIGVTYLLHQRVGVHAGRYWQALSKGLLPALLIALLAGFFMSRATGPGWLWLGTGVVIYSLVYAVVFWVIGLNSDEKSMIRSLLMKLHDPAQ